MPLGLLGVGAVSFKNYLDEVYFRRLRFIRKLARSYFKSDDGTEQFNESLLGNIIATSDGMHLYFGGMRRYIQSKFTDPTAIIYATRIEAIKLILEKAAKYGFKVAIMDVDSIQDYQKQLQTSFDLSPKEKKRLTTFQFPFLIINLRKIRHLHYDPLNETVRAGVGNRVSDINAYLQQFGKRLPF